MKRTPEEDRLVRNLSASRFSAEGFLGTDERPVDEIIAADARTLEEAGVTQDQVHKALADAYEKARSVFGAEVEVARNVTAVYHESMGRIPSPFVGDGVFEKGEADLEDQQTGDHLVVTRLGLALVEKHGFFEGRGSRYRIEPTTVVRMFGLGKE